MTARNHTQRQAAFTLVEILIAVAIFGVFMAGLTAAWSTLSSTALNTTAYAQRQTEEMRVLDYLKRDIRRATQVKIYNGATPVTGTGSGRDLELTIPDYYSDSREEDNAIGTKTTNTPTLLAGNIVYGTSLTVRYAAQQGAVVRDEASMPRTVASATGAFVLSFNKETSGAIRCRVSFDQPMRGGTNRTLRRMVDILCFPRPDLQL